MYPTAVVMNMFYTGLGIARSLGGHGIPVIGLSSRRGIYGNYTRHADVRRCPDSREAPEKLAEYLVELAATIGLGAIIFPTRDDDLLFLDLYRDLLSTRFVLPIPQSDALTACLDKWETYHWAEQIGVASPRSWAIDSERDLRQVLPEITFPCVMKPISAHAWRKGGNWAVVG